MSMNDVYQPINCDDYEHLEQACQQTLLLTLTLKNDQVIEATAREIASRKNVEYLVIDGSTDYGEIRLDMIYSFSHPDLGTVIVSYE